MKRIAVISDTHDRMPPGLPGRMAEADEIWHLGDVCEPETLAAIEELGKPLHIVLGNNEVHNLWPYELSLERTGIRFFLTHIPPSRAPSWAQVVLHGHTHVPRDETDPGGVRWLNPGCLAFASRGAPASFGWLILAPGQPLEWRIEKL